jgi:hypothetical protein
MAKLELHSNVKIKILEKKPTNGGIPAADKNEIKITFVKKLLTPIELK